MNDLSSDIEEIRLSNCLLSKEILTPDFDERTLKFTESLSSFSVGELKFLLGNLEADKSPEMLGKLSHLILELYATFLNQGSSSNSFDEWLKHVIPFYLSEERIEWLEYLLDYFFDPQKIETFKKEAILREVKFRDWNLKDLTESVKIDEAEKFKPKNYVFSIDMFKSFDTSVNILYDLLKGIPDPNNLTKTKEASFEEFLNSGNHGEDFTNKK